MDELKLQAENSQALDDWSKSQEELIAELAQLRNEVASLKQSSSSSTKIIPPSVETIPAINLFEFPQSYTPTILLLEDSVIDRATYRRFLSKNPKKKYNIGI